MPNRRRTSLAGMYQIDWPDLAGGLHASRPAFEWRCRHAIPITARLFASLPGDAPSSTRDPGWAETSAARATPRPLQPVRARPFLRATPPGTRCARPAGEPPSPRSPNPRHTRRRRAEAREQDLKVHGGSPALRSPPPCFPTRLLRENQRVRLLDRPAMRTGPQAPVTAA
jgi:hypothetical protein